MVAAMPAINSTSAVVLERHGLSEAQRDFVVHIIGGTRPVDAAIYAGFNRNHAYQLLRVPAIRLAIHECIQADLVSDAPANLKVLRTIRDDETAPKGVRSDIAIKLMRLAGHIEPTKADDNGPTKQLSEMSADELRQYIERNQAEIDRIEGELAARAIDVSAPDSTPNEPIEQANPLNYLD
jgi:uncharacterized small protein (DUF1192 family)